MKVIKKGADEMQWIITKTDDSIAEQKMGENIFVGVLCVVALAAGIWGWWMERGFFTSKKEEKEVPHLLEDE